ncbi:MAG: TerC family protein [Gemmataceae bacterium]|nr:TerC family protein [Gemmataceae bacterium]
MPRRLPTVALVVGLTVLLVLVRPALAEDPAGGAGAQFVTVRAEPADGGPAVEGTLLAPEITVETETGRTIIGLPHVRRITFQREPGGKAHDTVQLLDRSVVRGRVTADTLPVRTGDGATKALKPADLREVRVVRAEQLSPFAVLLGLLTLTAMEIVLGIDNVIFLAIVAGKLPLQQQPAARRLGLAAALGTRILLLLTLSFLLGLTTPVFTLPDLPFLHDLEAREVSWRDLILIGGGLFLIGKSVFEMHEKLEAAKAGQKGDSPPPAKPGSFARAIVTIAVIDLVFSLDSVITAVGMVEQIWVMVVAMVLAMLVMLWFSGPISRFVDRHPTIKVLALAFLILIGVMLVVEGLGQHIDKGYIYFAMAFAVAIEMVNMRLQRSSRSVTEPLRPTG